LSLYGAQFEDVALMTMQLNDLKQQVCLGSSLQKH